MELLTKAERLTQEQSRSREKVIALNKKTDTEAGLTDEERAELSTHVDRLEAIEPEIRAATTAAAAERAQLEEEARKAGPDDGVTPEVRERNELAKKARLGTYLLAAISGRRVSGPEAELREALDMGDDAIPTACMDVDHREQMREQHRAITPAPGTKGVSMGMVRCSRSCSLHRSLIGLGSKLGTCHRATMPSRRSRRHPARQRRRQRAGQPTRRPARSPWPMLRRSAYRPG